MKHIYFVSAVLVLIVLTACNTSVSPIQVPSVPGTDITSVVQDWIKANINVPYKDVRIKTLKQDDAFATVEVRALLRKSPDKDWDEHIAIIELKKVGQEWRIDKAGQFISPAVEATATAVAFSKSVKSADLHGVFMLSASEGWAVGRLAGDIGCAILQYKDGVWQSIRLPANVCSTGSTLSDVQMISQNEGWAVGYKRESEQVVSPIILHYLNGAWQTVPSPTDVDMSNLSMVSKDEGWAVGLKRDWSKGGKTTSVIQHYRNGKWEVENVFNDLDINDIFMLSPDEGWAVGAYDSPNEKYDIALRYNKGKWELKRLSGARIYLTALHMTSPSDGWAVGLFGVRRYRNGDWENVDLRLGPLYDIHMPTSTEGWAVGRDQGSSYLARYSNGKWERVPTPDNAAILGIFMLSPSEGWAVGERGVILYYRNGAWTRKNIDEQAAPDTITTHIATQPTRPSGSTTAQQIAFAVKEGKFTHLKIEGTNQEGKWSAWETKSDNGLTIALTKDYWWKGTVVLIFDIVNLGRRTCVIDYLREAPGSTVAAITYTEGQGCNGEGGSAQNATLIAGLVKYMTAEESYQVVEAAQYALDAQGCVQGIMNGFASGLRGKILTIKDCSGAALYIINGIMQKYNMQVSEK